MPTPSTPSTPVDAELDAKPFNNAVKSTGQAFSIPINSTSEHSQPWKNPFRKQLMFMRSRSDADKLESEEEGGESDDYRMSKSADDLTLSGEEGTAMEEVEASLETASHKIEEILSHTEAKRKSSALSGFVAGLRKSGRRIKYRHRRRARIYSDSHGSRSGSTTPTEAQYPDDSPQDSPQRKKKFLKKSTVSLLFFSQDKDEISNHSAKLPEEKKDPLPSQRQLSAESITTSSSGRDLSPEAIPNPTPPPTR